MDFNKVRVVSFALRNRLLGYRLVKNPKWKSPYYVKMVKIMNNCMSDELDIFDHRCVKSRDFSKKGKTDKKLIYRHHYMFWPEKDNQKVEHTMPVYIHKKSNGEIFTDSFEPDDISDRLTKRDTRYINTIYGTDGAAYANEGFLPRLKTIADIYIENFKLERDKREAKIFANSFWSTLRANLRK